MSIFVLRACTAIHLLFFCAWLRLAAPFLSYPIHTAFTFFFCLWSLFVDFPLIIPRTGLATVNDVTLLLLGKRLTPDRFMMRKHTHLDTVHRLLELGRNIRVHIYSCVSLTCRKAHHPVNRTLSWQVLIFNNNARSLRSPASYDNSDALISSWDETLRAELQ